MNEGVCHSTHTQYKDQPLEMWFHHGNPHNKVHEDGEGHHGEAQKDSLFVPHAGQQGLGLGPLTAVPTAGMPPVALLNRAVIHCSTA